MNLSEMNDTMLLISTDKYKNKEDLVLVSLGMRPMTKRAWES